MTSKYSKVPFPHGISPLWIIALCLLWGSNNGLSDMFDVYESVRWQRLSDKNPNSSPLRGSWGRPTPFVAIAMHVEYTRCALWNRSESQFDICWISRHFPFPWETLNCNDSRTWIEASMCFFLFFFGHFFSHQCGGCSVYRLLQGSDINLASDNSGQKPF